MDLVKSTCPSVCGGVVVKPGDIVVGDRDGVAVIPLEEAENVLAKVKDIIEQEKMSTIEIDENAHLPWSTNRPWIDKILREKGAAWSRARQSDCLSLSSVDYQGRRGAVRQDGRDPLFWLQDTAPLR